MIDSPPSLPHFAALLLLLLNVFSFIIYGVDKWKAQHKKERISERTLLVCGALAGGWGACLGMVVWNHKTSHRRFRYLIPLFVVIQTIQLLWLAGAY